jgi:hypothetical protein
VTDTYLEIERTYDLPDGAALPDLIGIDGILRTDRQQPIELDATYWDTERYDLVASQVTVRRRTGGTDAGWHIKRASSDTVRHEQHFPLTDDPDAVPVEVLAALFVERRGRGLHPVVRIETTRTVTRLLDEDGDQVAELADDSVTATRLDDDAPDRPRQWREVEVELTGVAEARAAKVIEALDRRFADIGAGPAAVSSKLARGLAGAPAPRLQTAEKPERGTAARVVTKRLRKLRSALVEGQIRAGSGDTQDLAAFARTAVGISAILTVYREAFTEGPEFDAAVDAAEQLAIAAARANSADDLVGHLHRASTPQQDALIDAEARERILAATRERRDDALRDLVRFGATEPYVVLLDALDDAVERPEPTEWASRSPKKVAQDITGEWKPRVREAIRGAVGDDPLDEAADLEATEHAWAETMRLRVAMDVLGDDAFAHSLWRRVSVASDVLTERVQSLLALAELRRIAAIAKRGDEDTFGYGVLAGDRVRRAEESFDDAMQSLGRV